MNSTLKIVALSLGLFLGGLSASAQQFNGSYTPSNSITINVGAQSRGLNIKYSRSFFSEGVFTLNGGIYAGYGYSGQVNGKGGDLYFSSFYQNNALLLGKSSRKMQELESLSQVNLGLELETQVGNGSHRGEIGLGWGLDISDKAINFASSQKALGETPSDAELLKAKGSKIGDSLHARLGYRYLGESGFTIGAGLSCHFYQGLFTYYYAYPSAWMPYLSIGYAF